MGPGRGGLSQAFHRVTSPPPIPTRDLGADWEPRSHQERTNSGDALGDALRSGLFRICAGDLPGQWRKWDPAEDGVGEVSGSEAPRYRGELPRVDSTPTLVRRPHWGQSPWGRTSCPGLGGTCKPSAAGDAPEPPCKEWGTPGCLPCGRPAGACPELCSVTGHSCPRGWVDTWVRPGERSAHAAEPRSPGLNKVC